MQELLYSTCTFLVEMKWEAHNPFPFLYYGKLE